MGRPTPWCVVVAAALERGPPSPIDIHSQDLILIIITITITTAPDGNKHVGLNFERIK